MADRKPVTELFEEHLLYELNRSRLTVEAYLCDISQFATFLSGRLHNAEDSGQAVIAATTTDIRLWLGSLANDGGLPPLLAETRDNQKQSGNRHHPGKDRQASAAIREGRRDGAHSVQTGRSGRLLFPARPDNDLAPLHHRNAPRRNNLTPRRGR